MATLNEAQTELQAWIDEIDQRMEGLSLQRRAMAATLVALGYGGLPDRTAEAVVVAPKPDVLVDLADIEARRKADRERKKAERERNKTTPPVARKAGRPGGSKYDYDEVVRVANAAIRGSVSMVEAVASRYGVSSAMGSYLIKEARKRGHDIAKVGHGVKAAASNVSPIVTATIADTANHPASRAFTPADTLRIIEGGVADG